jgi:hypothetical protein
MLLTAWFPAGCYITRRPGSECQHFMRWGTKTRQGYSAGSTGTNSCDVIGWNNGSGSYDWRGLATRPDS